MRRPLSKLTFLGLCALAIANVTAYLLQRHSGVHESVSDPIVGFVYGIAIATTLLGLWRQSPRVRARCR